MATVVIQNADKTQPCIVRPSDFGYSFRETLPLRKDLITHEAPRPDRGRRILRVSDTRCGE